MKPSKIFLLLLSLMIYADTLFAQDHIKVFVENSVIWYGVDYSLARFVLVNRTGSQIVETDIPSINAVIVQDKVQYDLYKFFNKNSVDIELDNANANNQKINPSKLITGSPHSISQDDLEKLIGSYKTDGKMGMGLVFVAENMNKVTATGSFYVCFFDLVTKKIIDAERMEGKASGVGFRNYWASTVYAVMKNWSPKK
jgi:hypothetical protein